MRVIILHKLLCISLLYVSLLHLTCPQAIAASPVGTLDGVSPTGYINGWVYDPDSPNDSIDVHIYIDGPAEKTQNGGRFVALVKANLDSPDVNTAFNISGKHRFSYQLSGYDLIGYRGIYPHAIDPQGGLNPLLNNSPLYLGNPAPANNQLTRSVLGHPMTLKTFASLGGAIGSLTWNGQEFIDMHDHGRELQSASTFGYGCCYNPTEAGGDFDGLGTEPSSSQLLWYSPTTKGFEALTRMAFWYAPGKSADAWCYNSTPIVANTSKISNDLLYRNIEVGVDEFDNVIKYQTRFYIAPNQSANILDGYDRHQVGELEIVTGYMPPVFHKFEYYYPHFQELYPASDDYSNGFPLVFSPKTAALPWLPITPSSPLTLALSHAMALKNGRI